MVVADLGLVEVLTSFSPYHSLQNSAWADGSLAELAGQMGNMMEHLSHSQPNPGPRSPVSPYSVMYMHCALYFVYNFAVIVTWGTPLLPL